MALTTGRGRTKGTRFLSMVRALLEDLRAEESEMEAQRQDALDEALEVSGWMMMCVVLLYYIFPFFLLIFLY